MNWASGTVVFVIVWWCVFFMVLPWGNRPPERDELEPGQVESAPAQPRLWLKAGITSVAAAMIWFIVYFVTEAGLISFRGATW